MNEDILKILESRKEVSQSSDKKTLSFNKFSNQIIKENNSFKFHDQSSDLVSSDDSLMSHTFKISTETPDRVGDVMVLKGCFPHIQNYKNNPVVFFNHQQREFPIAKSSNPKTKEFRIWAKDGLFGEAFFHCRTEESEKTYELIKLGYLKGASIGFRPIKASILDYRGKVKDGEMQFLQYGLKMEEWELTEWSVVGIPMNQEALEGVKSWLGKNYKDNEFFNSIKMEIPEDSKIIVPIEKHIEYNTPVTEIPLEVTKDLPENHPSVPLEEIIVKEHKEKEGDETLSVTNVSPVIEVEQKVEKEVEEVKSLESETKILELEKTISEMKERELENSKKLSDLLEKFTKSLELKTQHAPSSGETYLDAIPSGNSESVVDIKEKVKKLPFGAEVLTKLCGHCDMSCNYINEKLDQIDNPKTKPFVKEVHDGLRLIHKGVKKFGQKYYADHFPKEDKKEFEGLEKIFEILPSGFEEELTIVKSEIVKEDPKDLLLQKEQKDKQDKLDKFWADCANLAKEIKEMKVKVDDKIYSLTGK